VKEGPPALNHFISVVRLTPASWRQSPSLQLPQQSQTSRSKIPTVMVYRTIIIVVYPPNSLEQ